MGKDFVANQLIHRTPASQIGAAQLEGGHRMIGQARIGAFLPALAGGVPPFADPLPLRILAAQHTPLTDPLAVQRVHQSRHARCIRCRQPASRRHLQLRGYRLELPLGVIGIFGYSRCGGRLHRKAINALVLQLRQSREAGQQIGRRIDCHWRVRPIRVQTIHLVTSLTASIPREYAASRQVTTT